MGSGQSLEQSDLVVLEEIGTELGDDEEEEEEEADEAKESPDPTPIYTCSGCQIWKPLLLGDWALKKLQNHVLFYILIGVDCCNFMD